jgi:choline kinase
MTSSSDHCLNTATSTSVHPTTIAGAVPMAVLLAAGRGSRLGAHTDERPKCLVEVNGRSMLERLLEEVVAVGVRHLVVVVGYRDDMLRARIGTTWGPMTVEYVHNAAWASTNNIVSLALAADRLTQDFLLLESDVLLEPGLLATLLPPNAAAVGQWRDGMDGTVLDVDAEGQARTMYLKTTPGRPADLRALFKTVNVYSVRAHDFARAVRPRLDARVRAGDVHAYYEAALADAVADGALRLRAVSFDGGRWTEVDDPTDLALAERTFSDRTVASIPLQ